MLFIKCCWVWVSVTGDCCHCRIASQLTTLPCAPAVPLTVPAQEVFIRSATVCHAIMSSTSLNIPLTIISVIQPFQTSGHATLNCRDILWTPLLGLSHVVVYVLITCTLRWSLWSFCPNLCIWACVAKKCMEYEVEGSRPKRTWRAVVVKDCQGRKLEEIDKGCLMVRMSVSR